jgi:hypothetical protein
MERFALPDSLDGLSSDEALELEGKANDRLAALRGVSNPTGEDVAELAAIKAFRTQVRELRQTSSDFAASLADLEPEPEPEPVVEASVADLPGSTSTIELEPVEPVVAAARSQAAVPSTAIPEAPARPPLVIVAAADIPQVPMGSHLDFDQLASAVANKARVLGNSTQRHPVATFEKYFTDEYDISGLSDIQVANRLDEFAGISNYEKALTAGGWCAPSEIIFSLFETLCPNPNLFDLPTFRANRGGVRWPTYEPLDFTGTYDWIWTEADGIAATGTKPCIEIPCPVFEECRLEAHGICVLVQNFMDRGYPEQVAWYMRRVFFFHARAESLRKINFVIADSDAAVIAPTFGAASAVMAAVLLQVQAYRDRNGLCCGQMVEAWAPCWLKEAIRADVGRQDCAGVGNAGLVTDAQINAWFATAGVSINWLSYWQAFEEAAPGPLVWPATVQILIHTPGAYVQFDGGTLDLGVTRDSVLNSTNHFNIFTEDFFCIGRRGPRGVLITIPICPLGEVGGRNPSSGEVICPAA